MFHIVEQGAGGSDGSRQAGTAVAVEIACFELIGQALACRIQIKLPGSQTSFGTLAGFDRSMPKIIGNEQFGGTDTLQFLSQQTHGAFTQNESARGKIDVSKANATFASTKRPDDRHEGKESVSTCRTRGMPVH